jgi:hypothetical protein
MIHKFFVFAISICGILSQNAEAGCFGKKRNCGPTPVVCNPCQSVCERSTMVQLVQGPIDYSPTAICSPLCPPVPACAVPCGSGSSLGVDEFGDTITAILSQRSSTPLPVSGDPDDLIKIEDLLIEILKNRNEVNISEEEARQLIEKFREQLP